MENLGPRVGVLEQGFAEMKVSQAETKAMLGGVGQTLIEIKASMSSGRPPWHVVVMVGVPFLAMVLGGVIEFDSIRGDIAAFRATKEARDGQFEAIDRRLGLIEQRQWEELRADRDRRLGK